MAISELDLNDFYPDYYRYTICEMYGCDFYEAEDRQVQVCRDCHREIELDSSEQT